MIVDDIKFTKDKKTGYYLSSKKINGKRIRLHRYIYEKLKGEIPKGYEVHHVDQDKENNNIDNLELLLKKEHRKIHSMTLTVEERERKKTNNRTNGRGVKDANTELDCTWMEWVRYESTYQQSHVLLAGTGRACIHQNVRYTDCIRVWGCRV